MRPPGRRAEGDKEFEGLDWDLLKRIGHYARPHWRVLAISLSILPITAGLQLVQPWLIKNAIDGPIASGDATGLVPIAIVLFAVLMGNYTLQFIGSYASHLGGQGIVHDLRVGVHAHLLTLHDRYFQRNPAGRLLTRCTNDVEGIGEMFAAGFLTLFGDVVLLLGICGALLLLDWKLALVTFAALPVLIGVSQWFQAALRNTYRELRRRVSELNAYLQERISGIKIIQLFAREARTYSEFKEHNAQLMSENFRSIRLDAMLFAFVDAMAHLVTALLIAWAARPIVDDALTFGALVAFLDYVSRFFQPIRDLSQKVATLQSGLASSERVFSLLDETERVEDPVGGGHDEAVRGTISFDRVHFAYKPEEPVLCGLDLEVTSGEKVALLGVTGAGKTTALRLLGRVYDPDRGRVVIDGVPVTDWSVQRLRRSIGVVLQDVFLFMGSVRDNVTLHDASISDETVWAALEQVGAAELVKRIGGLGADLAERGGNLSAGERQLLAFARVMVYDPAILLLDEATSNVDTFAEARIQEAIATAMEGRTTLVVAHRLSTIQQVDRVAVLHQGELAEIGTHRELLAVDGLYRRLYETYFAAGDAA
ncbi:MAG: ABC transporter ATP-binding protein [Proteobacteria bacterium]|nr:ABC transporter ATP-binding protein [Pseudomonadota bacterium]